jgi:CheY-like chemotaxis protein
LIYAVDDMPDLIELYTALLEASGCVVRAFSHRAKALAALMTGAETPDLLITDYRNASMPVDRFIDGCLRVHPGLRILMVSGYAGADARLSPAGAVRYLPKPFTSEEFRREVANALAGC